MHNKNPGPLIYFFKCFLVGQAGNERFYGGGMPELNGQPLERRFRTALNDVTSVACNRLWRMHLHQRNWQILQSRYSPHCLPHSLQRTDLLAGDAGWEKLVLETFALRGQVQEIGRQTEGLKVGGTGRWLWEIFKTCWNISVI